MLNFTYIHRDCVDSLDKYAQVYIQIQLPHCVYPSVLDVLGINYLLYFTGGVDSTQNFVNLSYPIIPILMHSRNVEDKTRTVDSNHLI